MSDGKDGCIVVIGLIASLIGIFVFFTGKADIWEVFGWASVSTPVPVKDEHKQDDPQVSGNLQPASETIQLAKSSIGWPGRLLLWYEQDGNISELTSNGKLKPLFPIPPSLKGSSMHWSPDGKQIAYLGESADGKNGLFVMDSNGTNARMIFEFDAPNFRRDSITGGHLAWFPDSKSVVVANGISGFTMIDIDTGEATMLGLCENDIDWSTGGPHLSSIAISRDGSKFAFNDGNKPLVAVRPVDNGQCTVWLEGSDFLDWLGILIFTEDGNELIYSNEGELYRIPAPGTSSVKVIPMGRLVYNWEPPKVMVLSPDGRYIALRGSYGAIVLDTITGSYEQVLDDAVYGSDSLGWLP